MMDTFINGRLLMGGSYPNVGPFVEFQADLSPGVFTYSDFEMQFGEVRND